MKLQLFLKTNNEIVEALRDWVRYYGHITNNPDFKLSKEEIRKADGIYEKYISEDRTIHLELDTEKGTMELKEKLQPLPDLKVDKSLEVFDRILGY